MKKKPLFLFHLYLSAILLILVSLVASPASAVTIDFDSLEQPGDLPIFVPSPYLEDGFSIATPDPFGLQSYQQSHVAYAGSAGLAHNFSYGVLTLTRIDGGAFSLDSIELSILRTFSNIAQPVFTGLLSGGGSTQQSFVVSQFGYQSFAFNSSFSNVTSVSWAQGDNTYNSHSFDNIVTSAPNPIPEPTTILLVGSGLIGLVGFRRKFRRGK
jgi:hypothetical protein